MVDAEARGEVVGGSRESADIVELEVPPRPEVVAIARLLIGAIASADPDFDEEREADLRLAVSEACTNAVQAQRRRTTGADDSDDDDGEIPVLVRFLVERGQITVAVRDHAGGFDPATLTPHPVVTDPARLDHEGGLGIPLMQMLADEVAFDPSPGGTTVSMVFQPRSPRTELSDRRTPQ